YYGKNRNSTSNHAIIYCEAATEWTNIKSKSATEIDNIIKEYNSPI
ncbi:2811_t:CDS:1, partial [Funneliformis geosporum]